MEPPTISSGSSRSPPLFDCQRAARVCHPATVQATRRSTLDLLVCQVEQQGVKGWPWHRPIVPRGCPRSIVGAGAFHDRVREGNGWVRPAGATEASPVRSFG
jgi:hypothetical protein